MTLSSIDSRWGKTACTKSDQETDNGFSMVELIVVVAIIGIIVLIAIIFFGNAQDNARQAAVEAAARDGHVLAEANNANNGFTPTGVLSDVSTENVRVVMADSFVAGRSETICVQATWRGGDNSAVSGQCEGADDNENMFPPEPEGDFNILWDVSEDRNARSPFSFPADETGLTVTIPIQGNIEGVLDWGDGTVERISGDNPTHTYDSADLYEITLTEAHFDSWVNIERQSWTNVDVQYDLSGLRSVDVWTNMRTLSASGAFAGAVDLEYVSPPPPSLTNMENMFFQARSFNGDVSGWDVSNVVSMDAMFYHAHNFNQSLNDWDISSAENISHMFWGASDFNQPLDQWDVSSVTSMEDMFRGAESFNQPLNDWDTSRLRNAGHMFYQASSFNQPLDEWDVSNVRIMRSMFRESAFNQDISGWDVSSVHAFDHMFANNAVFDYDLSDWTIAAHVEEWQNFNGGESALSDAHVPDFEQAAAS